MNRLGSISVPDFLEKYVYFEDMLYSGRYDDLFIYDYENDFVISEILHFAQVRPFLLDGVIKVCSMKTDVEFKKKLIFQALRGCPIIVYLLETQGYFVIDEVLSDIVDIKPSACHIYYHQYLDGITEYSSLFAKNRRYFEDNLLFNDCIKYGYSSSSFEFFLKYDMIDELRDFLSLKNNEMIKYCEASPFEWAMNPSSYDPLSFSAHFGSVKVFKMLILQGYNINDNCILDAISGGNIDIISSLSLDEKIMKSCLSIASQYFHNEIWEWIQEKKLITIKDRIKTPHIRLWIYLFQIGLEINPKYCVQIQFLW